DAFVTDEYRWAGDELAHLVLALAAERAIERVLGLAASDLAHPALRALPARRGSGTLSLPGPGLRIRSAQPINQPGSTTRLRDRPLVDDLVDQPKFLGRLRGHEGVALERVLDLLERLAGMLHVDIVEPLLQVQNLLSVQHDVGRLALEAAGRLMHHDAGVRE